jgi:hypothetical protein
MKAHRLISLYTPFVVGLQVKTASKSEYHQQQQQQIQHQHQQQQQQQQQSRTSPDFGKLQFHFLFKLIAFDDYEM